MFQIKLTSQKKKNKKKERKREFIYTKQKKIEINIRKESKS